MTMNNGTAYDCLLMMVRLREKGKLGLVIAKNARKLQAELQEYIEKRDEIVKELGVEKNGQYVIEGPENVKAFMDRIAEYNSLTFEFQPQTVDDETFCSGGLTSDQMYVLDWMVEE